jgi:hypothetical protein
MVAEIAALDFFTLFVQYVFGSFWLAVFGLSLVMFVIMGVLGRISIYSTMWYGLMFIQVMALGYGYVLITTFITLCLLIAFFFSWKSYIDVR